MRRNLKKHFTFLLFLLLATCYVPKVFSQVNFPGGRIAISFDGNVHDKDDWAASAMALAMIDAADLKNKVVHVDFNNHLGQTQISWEEEMKESCLGGAERFGFNKALFFDNQNNLNSSISNLASAINASSSGNPLWILAAGPMEVVWRGINASDQGKRKFIRVVSHSSWNENHDKSDHGGSGPLQHNWRNLTSDFQGDGVIFYRIKDQNASKGDNDFNTPDDKWFWLKNASDADWRWLYGRDDFSDKFDVSDAGMAYWLISGGPNGGCENCGWQETKTLLSSKSDDGEVANAAPRVNAGSDKTLTLPANNIILTATASDSDGKIVTYAWKKISGPAASLSDENSSRLNVADLVAGKYSFEVTVKDNQGATASDQVAVEVKEEDHTTVPTVQSIPGKVEAEGHSAMSGIQNEPTDDTGGGENIGWVKNGDWADYQVAVASSGTYQVAFRVASETKGGSISLKQGSKTLGSVEVNNTGGWQNWQTVTTEVALSAGSQTLRLAFSGNSDYLFNVNYLHFTKATEGGSTEISTMTLSPIQDAYLEDGRRYNRTELRAELDKRFTYLMFDLSSLSGQITEARLELTVASDPGYGSIQVARASHSNWTEDNLSDANKPSAVETLSSVSGTFSSGEVYSFELSDLDASGKLSLIISHPSGNDVAFASSEHGNASARPQLIVSSRGSNARTVAGKQKVAAQILADELLSEEQMGREVHLYPNPADAYLVVEVNTEGGYAILNQNGQVVRSGTVNMDRRIDVGSLKNGIYFLRFTSQGQNTYRKLLIHH